MLSRPDFNALLLITHLDGARSFDYEDRWDGSMLIYTGRGKTGDQELVGPNRDVAENKKRLLVLEAVGTRRLRYLGEAKCLEAWQARALDSKKQPRDVWKFRLSFDRTTLPPAPSVMTSRHPLRRSRPFASHPPSVRRVPTPHATPEEIATLQEKSNRAHWQVLARLAEVLKKSGWRTIEEIPAAVDLWAVTPEGNERVIFEVKTLSDANELHQCRAALAQLLEYRFFYGKPSDRLCLVLSGPIADRRLALLEEMGIAIVLVTGEDNMSPIGRLAQALKPVFGIANAHLTT